MLYAMMTTAKKASLAVRPWPRARERVVVILLERGREGAMQQIALPPSHAILFSSRHQKCTPLRSNAPSLPVSPSSLQLRPRNPIRSGSLIC